MQSFTEVAAKLPALVISGALALGLFSGGAALAASASVPYVPTPQVVVDRMLELGKVGPQDYLIDLGSGDGRIVVTAAKKYGTRGFGVDLNPTRIREANDNAVNAGVTDKVQFFQRDLFETDLTRATVITMYLLPRVNLMLRPKLLDLRPGTRIVSHDFSMDDWKPEHHEQIDAKDKYGGSGGQSDVYLWIVPAKVAGSWQSDLLVRGKPVPYAITFDQKFQMVSGTAQVAGQSVKLENAKLSGDVLTFEFNANVQGTPIKHRFNGVVSGSTIGGSADLSGPKLQSRTEWNAVRTGQPAAANAAPVDSRSPALASSR